MKSKTIVFIHGMYMTPLCWEQWGSHYKSQGYHCLAPGWPGRDKPVETLRQNHPDLELGRLTLNAVVEHFNRIIKTLNEKPIVIGHSMGGLVTQLLLQRDLAAAAIVIDSAPPAGVFTAQWSFLKSNWPHITPFAPQNQPIAMTFERFQYAFVNNLSLEDQRGAFEKYVVPESRRVPRESLMRAGAIDFRKPHAPLLFVAGSNDNIIPALLNKINCEKYKASNSITELKEFSGRTHFIIGQKNWEEVADYILGWLREKGV